MQKTPQRTGHWDIFKMDIKHDTLTNVDQIIKTYKQTEGVDVKYVCTTDIVTGNTPADIFYRDTKHPEYNNNYFGLLINGESGVTIMNADMVTELHFGMVENDDGLYEYSRTADDTKVFANGNEIAGGRLKIVSNAPCDIFKIVDGDMQLQAKFDDYNTVDGTEAQ